MKDILISITSRDRPSLLAGLISDIYNKSHDTNNFDIHVLVDDDQLDLYKKHINKHDVIFDHQPHKDIADCSSSGFSHLTMRQLEFYLSKDYYFMWILSDDVIYIQKDWDVNIVCKKNFFPDNLFVLYTQSKWKKRKSIIKANCYIEDDIDHFSTIWHKCEMLPIMTRVWVSYLYKFYTIGSGVMPIDLMVAAMIQQLCFEYNENRHVQADLYKLGVKSNGNTTRLVTNAGKAYEPDKLHIIVNEMNEYIIKHNLYK